jgi:ArsR family transcriptional regulator
MPVELQGTVTDVPPEAAELLRLLADPTRRQIFMTLMQGEFCNCELAAGLGLPRNLVSHHVRSLREAGLVQEHKGPSDARSVHIVVDPEALGGALASLCSALDPAHVGTRLPACGQTAR